MLVGLIVSYDIRFREEAKHMLGAEDLEGGCSFFTSFKEEIKFCAVFRGGSIFFAEFFPFFFKIILTLASLRGKTPYLRLRGGS